MIGAGVVMKPQPTFSQISRPSSQRGIATVLIVILIGVALTATAMSIMHSTRSTQEKQVAVHAATNAQNGAWTAVEAFRLYLNSLTAPDVDALSGNMSLSIGDDAYGNMSIQNIEVTTVANSRQVKATVVNTRSDARSSAALDVVYEVSFPAASESECGTAGVICMKRSLEALGQITFTLPLGTKPNIYVEGNVSMMNVGDMSLGILRSTGTVNLDSNMRVDEIYSNGDVSLTGDARTDKVTTRGTVTTGGSGGARIIWANGAVTLNGTLRTDAANSLSTISVNPATPTVTHGLLKAKENVTVGKFPKIESIQTKRNVVIDADANNPLVSSIIAERNLKCTPASWSNFTSVILNGVVDAACTAPLDLSKLEPQTTVLTNQSASISVMNEIQPIFVPSLIVDVWTLKQYANYIFEWDSEKTRTKVTVNNISGVPNGSVFWVGDYPSVGGAPPHMSYLCNAFDGAGNCTAPAAKNLGLCVAHSPWNGCFSYNTGTKTWKFNDINNVPGILWFDGNVDLNNGSSYSTILATGNVTLTSGLVRLYSVNYAGFDIMCKANGVSATYKSMFEDQIPTNLCDMAQQKYIPLDVGNIGIAAGGFNPADNGDFSGGIVNVGANNKIFGMVLAGDNLVSGGQTEIYGQVTAAGQNIESTQGNFLGGNTTLDMTRGSETYNPSKIPDMSGGAGPSLPPPPTPPSGARLLWSKYL